MEGAVLGSRVGKAVTAVGSLGTLSLGMMSQAGRQR